MQYISTRGAAPVLTFTEAADHPHNRARGVFSDAADIRQPNPAPRFSATPPAIDSGRVGVRTVAEAVAEWTP